MGQSRTEHSRRLAHAVQPVNTLSCQPLPLFSCDYTSRPRACEHTCTHDSHSHLKQPLFLIWGSSFLGSDGVIFLVPGSGARCEGRGCRAGSGTRSCLEHVKHHPPHSSPSVSQHREARVSEGLLNLVLSPPRCVSFPSEPHAIHCINLQFPWRPFQICLRTYCSWIYGLPEPISWKESHYIR